MEVSSNIKAIQKRIWLCCTLFFLLMAMATPLHAQPTVMKYSISKGGMQITLSKGLKEKDLDKFIKQYELGNLALKQFISSNFQDSIKKQGWKVVTNNKEIIVITKPFLSSDNIIDPAELIKLEGMATAAEGKNLLSNTPIFGINNFRSKYSFTIEGSVVTFVLHNNKTAKKVLLAGSFTNWQTAALPMTLTDSGWSATVKLNPGKYLYKFIADGNWMTDPDNIVTENDGEGNTNSVYYFTNTLFRLDGFTNAKKVFVSGSFNNWQEGKLWMIKTATGWQLPMFLNNGTYTYRYVADGQWMADPANANRFANEHNDFNSVISIGTPTLFTLPGFQNAQKVFLAGSFNGWHNYEIAMTKTTSGWKIPYVLGAGNYEYKFYVDEHWVDAAGNQIKKEAPGTVFVIGPNYTFHLKSYENAKNVFVSGEFNNWSPNAYAMKREGNNWMLPLHLSIGKHLYKFVIDGQWIKDPANELWEQNEFGTGNSILWVK